MANSILRMRNDADRPRAVVATQLTEADRELMQHGSDGQFERGWRAGSAGISAGAFANDAISGEMSGTPNWQADRDNALRISQRAAEIGPRVSSLRDVHGAGDALDYASGSVGQGLASMTPTLAAALLTRGRGGFGKATAFGGAMIPAYRMERGEAVVNQYADPTLAAASVEDRDRVAMYKGGVNAVLESIVPAGLAGSILRKPTTSFLGAVGRNALTEGATEVAQEYTGHLAEKALDPSRQLDPMRLADAGVMGALTGGGVSAAGLAPSHLANSLMPAATKQQADPATLPPEAAAPPVAEPLAPAPVAPAAPGQFETILESAKERFGPQVEEAYGTAKDYVSAFAERANEAVKTAETPADFVNQLFRPSMGEQAKALTTPETEDPAVLNAVDPVAGLNERTARTLQYANNVAAQLLEDPATPQFVRDKVTAMGGDYSSTGAQVYLGTVGLAQAAGKKIPNAVADFVAFSKEMASKAGTVVGDIATGLTGKVSKKNLQDIHESDVQPLVNLLAQRLGPQNAADAPQLAKQLIAAANRLSPNGQINEAVDRRLRNFSEAIDDETLDMVTELSGSDALRNSIAKIRAIPSAMSDVRQAGGSSFLESLITNDAARQYLPRIAEAVDELALAGTASPARASALKALAAGVFGSVKNAQTVVDYYGKMRRSAYKLEAEQAKVQEDRTAATDPDMLPGEAVGTLRNPDGTQEVGTEYNALSEHDADRYEAQYRGINPYRPFFKGTDRKAFAQALKEAGPGAKRATLRKYLETTDESPAYVLARVRADLNKRITNAEERDTETVANAIKNLESVPAEDRSGPHAELLASLKGRKTETRSDLPTMRRQRDILTNALGVSFDDLSNLYRQMADTQSESGVEVEYDNVDSANSQAVAKIRASKSPDELQRMIESYTRRIPHWMAVPGDRAADVVDAMQYERSVAETRLEALKSGPEGNETRIIRKKLDALEKKLERNIPKALERMAVIVTADTEAVLRGRDTGATTEDVVNKYRSLLDKRRNPATKRKGEEQEAFEKRKAENESYNAKIAGTRVGFKVKGQKAPLYLSMESMLLNSPVYGSPSERLFAVISDILARSDVEGMIPPDPSTIVLRRVGAPDLLWKDIAPTGRGAPSKAQIERARSAAEEMIQRREKQKLFDAHTKAGMLTALEKVKYDFLVENLPNKSAVLSGMSLNAVAGLYPRGMDGAMLSAADDVAFESMLGWMDKATKMMRAAQAEADSAKAGLWPEGLKERLLQSNSRVRVLKEEILAQLNDRFPMASKAAITDSFADADNEGGMSKGAPTVGGVEPTTQMLYLEERLDVLKDRLEAVSHLVEVAKTIRSSIGTVESQIDELADKTSKEMRARPIPGRRTASGDGSGTAVENTTDEKALASLRTRLALLESRRDAAAENDAAVAKVGGAVATDVQKASQLLEEQIQSVKDSIKRYEKRPASSVEARRAAREEKAMDARTAITAENVKQAKAQATAMLESDDDAVVDRGHTLSNRIRAFEQNLKTQADIKQRNDDARAATGGSAKVVLPNTGPYTAKDQAKSDKANKFIGRGAPGSSTAAYAKAWGDRANTGEYAKNDTVFISVNGNRPGAITPPWAEIKKATSAGATLITDNPNDRARPFNTGERNVAEFLEAQGYVEKSPGTWTPENARGDADVDAYAAVVDSVENRAYEAVERAAIAKYGKDADIAKLMSSDAALNGMYEKEIARIGEAVGYAEAKAAVDRAAASAAAAAKQRRAEAYRRNNEAAAADLSRGHRREGVGAAHYQRINDKVVREAYAMSESDLDGAIRRTQHRYDNTPPSTNADGVDQRSYIAMDLDALKRVRAERFGPTKTADYAGIAKPFAKAVGDEAIVADAVSYMEDGAAKTVQKWRDEAFDQLEELSQEHEAYNPNTGEYDVVSGVMEGDQKLYDRLNATVEMYDALLKATNARVSKQNRMSEDGSFDEPDFSGEEFPKRPKERDWKGRTDDDGSFDEPDFSGEEFPKARKQSFVGAKADPEGAAQASSKLDAGWSADFVWASLGWFRGPDGKMRKEIRSPVVNKRIRDFIRMPEAQGMAAEPLFIRDLLKGVPGFEAYLDSPLGDVSISNNEMIGGRGFAGQFYPEENYIWFSHEGALATALIDRAGPEMVAEVAKDAGMFATLDDYVDQLTQKLKISPAEQKQMAEDALVSTILHEIQHAIQKQEGFENGGTPEAAVLVKYGLLDKYNAAESLDKADVLDEAMQMLLADIGPDADPRAAAHALYKDIIGEVEAHDVEKRMKLTDAEAKGLPPALADAKREFLRSAVNMISASKLRMAGKQTTIGGKRKPPNATEHAALKKKILEEIRRTRGNDVKLRFNRLIKHIGASGEFSMNADKTDRLIEIAVNAADPMGVAWHESLHDFFAMLGEDKAGRSIKRDLINASNAPQVKKRLRELLKDHPKALKQIEESAEERVAYMYQFWAAGDPELRVGPLGTGIFEKIRAFFRDLFQLVGRHERAQDLMAALHAGKFADTRVVAEVLADMPRDTINNRMEKYAPALKDSLDKLVQIAPDRLRDFQNEHISELADQFEDFVQRRFRKDGEWTNKLATILEGTTATQRRLALENMQAMKPPASLLENKLAKFFTEMHGYMTDAGVKTLDSTTKKWVPLRQVKDYFPRVFDRAALEKDPDGFVKLLMKHGNMTEPSARNTLKALTHGTGQLELAENEHALGFSPYAQAVQDRQLKFIDPTNAADFAKYQSKDLADITAMYVKQAVHRAEYARDFGNNGETIVKMIAESGITDKKDLENINKTVMGLEGTLGYEMSAQTKELFSGVMTLQNMVILPLAIFSQMIDPIVLAARSGDLKDAGNAYMTAIKKLTRQKDVDGEDLAEMLGIISQDTVLDAMGVAYGTTHMSKRMRNINRVFFKYNGMQGWNNSMRIAATVAGERYLLQNKKNVAALRELGLEPGDIKEKISYLNNVPQGVVRLDVSSQKVKEAMFKFVDQAVLRPSASNRPVWMSDPKFLLLAHLKQFTFAMHNVVLKRANEQLDDGNPKPWLTLALAMPTILVADMTKFALTGGPPPGWTFMDFLGHAVERSGLLGLGDFGAQAMQGVGQGKMPGEALLGPSFEHLMELLRFMMGAPGVDGGDVIDRTVPGARYV